MPAYVQHIATSVPQYSYRQDELRNRMKAIVKGNDRDRRIIHHIYGRSGIETRHSVVDDFREAGSQTLYFNGQGASPGTQSRNDTFIREARKLFTNTANKIIEESGVAPVEITHLITVSCTGFYAPGPDYDIIKSAGLKNSVERYNLGFMGCYAAIPALKLARQICNANEQANVLVVSVELCTLHFQAEPKVDDLVSASVFADGGAGALVTSSKPHSAPYFSLDGFASAITEKGEKDMAWSIGNNGFNMILSSYVPEILGEGLQPFLDPILKEYDLDLTDINLWGVHPGGRAILDKIEKTLDLPSEMLQDSRSVLANYGNMSSATILFVLKQLLHKPGVEGRETALAMAFGPGLTIESALLTKQSN